VLVYGRDAPGGTGSLVVDVRRVGSGRDANDSSLPALETRVSLSDSTRECVDGGDPVGFDVGRCPDDGVHVTAHVQQGSRTC
jgi:hypothetical protein